MFPPRKCHLDQRSSIENRENTKSEILCYILSPFSPYFNAYDPLENGTWVKGPPMATRRNSHSCGRILKDSKSQDFSIVVAGGWNDEFLSSVEILDKAPML
jgi:hypothetical protein